MPFNSSPYTDLILPTPNEDNSTYGTILNNYFQGLETKLKNLSDRINAAGVGSSSTLAQINRDLAQVTVNTSGILPDPYSGNYSTVSTWPAYNTELTALGISPPETASEIESFFSSGDLTTFVNFLNGKLDALDIIVTQAESDLVDSYENVCITDTYLDARVSSNISLVQIWQYGGGITYDFQGTTSFAGETYYQYKPTSGADTDWYSSFDDALGIKSGGSITRAAPLLTKYLGDSTYQQTALNTSTFGFYYTIYYPGLDSTAFAAGTNAASRAYRETSGGETSLFVNSNYTTGYQVLADGTRAGNLANALNFTRYQIRYGTPSITSCSNPSPPYFT